MSNCHLAAHYRTRERDRKKFDKMVAEARKKTAARRHASLAAERAQKKVIWKREQAKLAKAGKGASM